MPKQNRKKVNKRSKFDDNFDILRQLKHFKYEMNRTKITVYLNNLPSVNQIIDLRGRKE